MPQQAPIRSGHAPALCCRSEQEPLAGIRSSFAVVFENSPGIGIFPELPENKPSRLLLRSSFLVERQGPRPKRPDPWLSVLGVGGRSPLWSMLSAGYIGSGGGGASKAKRISGVRDAWRHRIGKKESYSCLVKVANTTSAEDLNDEGRLPSSLFGWHKVSPSFSIL